MAAASEPDLAWLIPMSQEALKPCGPNWPRENFYLEQGVEKAPRVTLHDAEHAQDWARSVFGLGEAMRHQCARAWQTRMPRAAPALAARGKPRTNRRWPKFGLPLSGIAAACVQRL